MAVSVVMKLLQVNKQANSYAGFYY